jgi:serine/threonine protein kinase
MLMSTKCYASALLQQGGTKVTAAVDIYALGMMLYELYTRQNPFPKAHSADIMTM